MISLFISSILLSIGALAGTASTAHTPLHQNKVYSYQCEANFLQGEGVTANTVACTSGQRLGLISARYTHYLFEGSSGENFSQRGRDEFYSNGVCGKNVLLVNCNVSRTKAEFALAAYPDNLFNIAIKLSPNRFTRGSPYGYAAAQMRKGVCPRGLVPYWAYVARPSTVESELPNNFINFNGGLDSYVIRGANGASPAFELYARDNTVPCDLGTGHCGGAEWGEKTLVQTVPYIQARTGVCVIPPGEEEFPENK